MEKVDDIYMSLANHVVDQIEGDWAEGVIYPSHLKMQGLISENYH